MPVEAQRVTMQMLNDVGLNPFALRLVAECFTRRKDFAEWTGPLSFIFDGLEFTIKKAGHSPAVPESAPPKSWKEYSAAMGKHAAECEFQPKSAETEQIDCTCGAEPSRREL